LLNLIIKIAATAHVVFSDGQVVPDGVWPTGIYKTFILLLKIFNHSFKGLKLNIIQIGMQSTMINNAQLNN
jgi:hypothetical protein